MCTTPILIMPNFIQEFTLKTDSSNKSVGAVLMQHERPIAYFNKVFGVKGQDMSIYEKKLMALLTEVQR
jgi:RNase H-like domain found in reverse transcriptase